MFGFEFANPKYFLLLILLVPMIVWYILKEKKSHADLQFSSLQAFKGIKHSGRIWWRDRKSTRLNSIHWNKSRMPSSA